jgi:hypothetical protein
MMKNSIVSVMVALMGVCLPPVRAQQQDESSLSEALREALFAEEADRDLAKAEKGYREILQHFDGKRSYVATATLRFGRVASGSR